MEVIDFIIIGSGCTGAMAAETLCQANQKVLMLDVGFACENPILSSKSFIEKRKLDNQQGDYFLGRNLEALNQPTHLNIPQETAQRKFMTDHTDKLIPIDSNSFFPVESLALGGLGNGWGLGSYVFSENELKKTGLPVYEMQEAYKFVAQNIGISGEKEDDASQFCHRNQIDLQSPTNLNPAAESLLKKYTKNSSKFIQKNIFLGRPSLALLSNPLGDRGAYEYKDLDFYENENEAAYRPSISIKKLVKMGKLQYKAQHMVLKFEEKETFTKIECLHLDSNEIVFFYTKKLILATGALQTSRLVLRSLDSTQKLPVLCNAYTYMPMVYLPFLGQANNGSMSGLAQLAMFYDEKQNHESVAMASMYNYRSLLNFRILRQLPLNYSDGMKILKHLIPALFVAGVFHPANYQNQNFIQLQKADSITGDCLKTHYTYENEEAKMIKKTEKVYSKAFFSLKCLILKKVRTATGGSIHYAGTLPFSDTEKPFHLSPSGKLYGTKRVFVADGSGIKFLPGKGLTLTLMANAHRIVKLLLENE